MKGNEKNITIYSGDYIYLEIEVYDEDNEPINHENITAEYYFGNKQPVFIKDNQGPDLEINGNNGTLTIIVKLQEQDTKNLQPHSYYHEIKIRDSQGKPNTIMTGVVRVLPTRL